MIVEIEAVRTQESELRQIVEECADSWFDGRTHTVLMDGAAATTTDDLLREIARAMTFPAYFGNNWDALNECFYDYFVLEDGGLGSEYADRAGIDALGVIMVILDAGRIASSNVELLTMLVRTIRRTAAANAERRAADLRVILQVNPTDSDETYVSVRQTAETT